jgi:hypothetical protein
MQHGDIGQIIIDGFMVMTGCAGFLFTAYGLRAWRISVVANSRKYGRIESNWNPVGALDPLAPQAD